MVKEKQTAGLTNFELSYRGDNHELCRPLLKYRKSLRRHAQKAYKNDGSLLQRKRIAFIVIRRARTKTPRRTEVRHDL